MRKLRFKSLTMRIWTIFTAIILIIICSISVLYLFAFRTINENAKIHDLMVVHDMLLKGDNPNGSLRFDELRNLKESDHFTITINEKGVLQINDMNRHKDGSPPQGKGGPMSQGVNNETRLWMASFAKNAEMNEQEFSGVYKGVKYNFIISSINAGDTGETYLISYMPVIVDNSLLYMVIGVGLAFIAIGFIAAKIVANRIARPLKELENYTLRIAKKDWKEPIEVNSEDEIGRLAVSMNHMQKELRRADEEEKMFLQSISHDLKTPVMVIMSHAEAIIDGVYIDSVEKTAEIIRDESISLEKKIKQLLYLNTLDYVLENNTEEDEVKLHELLLHIVNRFELVNSKIDWNLDIDKVAIKGNYEKLKVAVENIVENGLRYAEENISISLKQEGNSINIDIYNDGPNIEEKHIAHIFDNLYKDKTGNFGLGLAITKKILNFYNGEVKAVNREKGVSFIVKFPI